MPVEAVAAPAAAVAPITVTPLLGAVAAPSTIVAELTPTPAPGAELPIPDGAAGEVVLLEVVLLEVVLLAVVLPFVLRTPATGVGEELGALEIAGAVVVPSPATMEVPPLDAVVLGKPFTLEPKALSTPPTRFVLAGWEKVLAPLPEAAMFELLRLWAAAAVLAVAGGVADMEALAPRCIWWRVWGFCQKSGATSITTKY